MQLGQQHARHSRPISSQSQHARLRAKPRSMAAVDASRVSCDVAVIGSGLGGLAVAAGMRHRLGLDVQVYEAAASLGARSTTGTLIGLGANSFAALQELHPGIVAAFKELSAKTQPGFNLHYIVGGASTSSSSRGANGKEALPTRSKDDHPQWVPFHKSSNELLRYIQWAKAQEALACLTPPEAMHYGHAATGYTENADGTVTVHFTGHPSATARFVVAADGIRSAIRRQVCPSNSGPRYLGHMIFNALLFNPGGIKVCSHSPGSVDVFMEAEDSISAVLSDGVGGYAYWAVRLSSQEVDLTNGKHGGLGIPGSKARVLQALATRPTWSNLAAVVAATEEGAIFERPLFDLLPLSSWSAAGGRVVLLGDSAHAMSPNAGQGASMAFEDAHTLCEELQRCGGLDGDLRAAVAAYEAARIPRTSRVQAFASENSAIAAIRNAARPADVTEKERPARFAEFLEWLAQYPNNLAGDPSSTYWRPL